MEWLAFSPHSQTGRWSGHPWMLKLQNEATAVSRLYHQFLYWKSGLNIGDFDLGVRGQVLWKSCECDSLSRKSPTILKLTPQVDLLKISEFKFKCHWPWSQDQGSEVNFFWKACDCDNLWTMRRRIYFFLNGTIDIGLSSRGLRGAAATVFISVIMLMCTLDFLLLFFYS